MTETSETDRVRNLDPWRVYQGGVGEASEERGEGTRDRVGIYDHRGRGTPDVGDGIKRRGRREDPGRTTTPKLLDYWKATATVVPPGVSDRSFVTPLHIVFRSIWGGEIGH